MPPVKPMRPSITGDLAVAAEVQQRAQVRHAAQQRVEDRDFRAGVLPASEELGAGGEGAGAVDQQAHLHAAPQRRDQGVADQRAGAVAGVDVVLHVHVLARLLHVGDDGVVLGRAVNQQLHRVAGAQGHAGRHLHQLGELHGQVVRRLRLGLRVAGGEGLADRLVAAAPAALAARTLRGPKK
jgi:hypothetical protein